VLLGCVLQLIAAIVCMRGGALAFSCFPRVRMTFSGAADVFGMLFLLGGMCTPVIFSVWEAKKWRSYLRKSWAFHTPAEKKP